MIALQLYSTAKRLHCGALSMFIVAHLEGIQTTSEASPASCCSVCTWSRAAEPGSKHLGLRHSRVTNVWICICCTSTHPFTLTVWCSWNMERPSRYTLLTAQTVVWDIGGGLRFKTMCLFKGNRDTMLFQLMKNVVVFMCTLSYGTPMTSESERRWGKITVLLAVAQCSVAERHHYIWAYCLHLLHCWKQRYLWNVGAFLPDCPASHTRIQ
jgi:hypothetical protein